LLCINALNGSGGGHITMFQLEHGVNKWRIGFLIPIKL
jgi:hypothetical protein